MKRVAILMLVLLALCAQKGLEVVKLSPRDMVEQLKLGEIDAFVAWEPFVSEAVIGGYGEILATSAEIWPNHPCCVVAMHEPNESVAIALVWAHVKATRLINSGDERVIGYAVEFTGRSEEVVREAMKRIKFVEFPDVEQLKVYYEKLREFGYVKAVEELGYSEEEFFDEFVYRKAYDYVKGKLDEDPNWKPEKVNVTLRIGYLTADLHQLAFYVALREGYFDEVGIRVIPKEYPNGVYEMEAFKRGEIDAGYLGSAPAMLKRINDDVPISVVAGANNEGSAIVVKKGLKELRGKVAIPGFGTVQDFLLRMFAERQGIKL
ncbi:MAG: ABC transporter substrate-binding protein [Archaeoglobaceae archaeon]